MIRAMCCALSTWHVDFPCQVLVRACECACTIVHALCWMMTIRVQMQILACGRRMYAVIMTLNSNMGLRPRSHYDGKPLTHANIRWYLTRNPRQRTNISSITRPKLFSLSRHVASFCHSSQTLAPVLPDSWVGYLMRNSWEL